MVENQIVFPADDLYVILYNEHCTEKKHDGGSIEFDYYLIKKVNFMVEGSVNIHGEIIRFLFGVYFTYATMLFIIEQYNGKIGFHVGNEDYDHHKVFNYKEYEFSSKFFNSRVTLKDFILNKISGFENEDDKQFYLVREGLSKKYFDNTSFNSLFH